MAKAKRLNSGNWRTLAYSHTEIVDGKKIKRYESFTAETKAESEYMAAEFSYNKKKRMRKSELTVGQAVDDYIKSKDGILSGTTIAGYRKIRRNNLQGLMNMKLKDVDRKIIQEAVNAEAKLISPKTKKPLSAKTIGNAHGLVYSAIEMFAPDILVKTTLPRKKKNVTQLPTPDEIFKLIKGTDIELPCLLAMWLSFSMSEIRGIKISAIKDGCITITRVIVDVDGIPTEQDITKEYDRTRKSVVPPYLMNLIEQNENYIKHKSEGTDGYLITKSGKNIYDRFILLQQKAGFQHTRFHDLRAVNASVMLQLNIPNKYAQERGGWLTDSTLKSAYQKTFSSERLRVDAVIDEYFTSIVSDEITQE